jgi:hypothetical protein
MLGLARVRHEAGMSIELAGEGDRVTVIAKLTDAWTQRS